MKHLIFTLRAAMTSVLVSAAVLTVSGDDASPWDAWRQGYTCFEQGESLRDRGEYTRSLAAFEKALEHYRGVKKSRPDWNQRVIDERIADCERERTKVTRLLGKRGTVDVGEQQAIQAAGKVGGENAQLKRQLSAAELEAARLRSELAGKKNLESEIAHLIRDQRVAAEKYALLERRCRALERRGGGTAGDGGSALRTELVNAKLRIDTLRKQFDAASDKLAGLERVETELRHANAAAGVALRRQEDENRRLEREMSSLRDFQTTAVVRQGELNNSLVEAERRVAATLERNRELDKENAALREKLHGGTGNGSDLLAENRSQREQLGKLRTELESAKRDTGRERSRHDILKQQYDALSASLQRVESTRRELERQNRELRKSAADAGGALGITGAELTALREQAKKLSADLSAAVARNSVLEGRLKNRDSSDFKDLTAARDTTTKLNAALDKLQLEMVAMKSERDAARIDASGARSESAALLAENRRLTAAVETERIEARRAAAAVDGIKELPLKYRELQRNFAALKAESDENRLLVEAAKPREAELARVKLRLAELEELKSRLGGEQRLNAELMAEKRRLENALAQAKNFESELISLKRKSPEIESLKSELVRLRKLNSELVLAKNAEGDLARLKVRLAEAEGYRGELERLKKFNAELLALQAAQSSELASLKGAASGYAAMRREIERHRNEKVDNAALDKKYLGALSDYEEAKAVGENLRLELDRLKKYYAELDRLRAETTSTDLEKLRRAATDAAIAVAESAKLRAECEKLRLTNAKLVVADRLRNSAEAKLGRVEKELSAARGDREKLRRDKLELIAKVGRLGDDTVRLRSQVGDAAAREAELVRLRQVNAELAGAKALEGELAALKRKLAEFDQLKDELSRVTALNGDLIASNEKLNNELTMRRRSLLPGVDGVGDPDALLPPSRENPGDLVASGVLAETDGNVELAIWNYRRALKLDRNHAPAARRLGMVMLNREDFEAAAALLTIARAADPGNLELGLATARACIALGRFGNAQAIVEPLLKINPDNWKLQLASAQVTAGLGKPQIAGEKLRFAVRLAPGAFEPKLEMARFLVRFDSTRQEEAARLYDSARKQGAAPDLELEPVLGKLIDKRRDTVRFLTEAAAEAESGRDWKSAVWYYRQLVELEGDTTDSGAHLAYAQYRDGAGGAALETLSFRNSTALGELVAMLIHYRNREIPAAVQAARRAVSNNGGSPVAIPERWHELAIELESVLATGTPPPAALGEAFVRMR